MKRKLFSELLLCLLTGFLGQQAAAQKEKYRHPGTIGDLHTVYEFKKSNWDGSHASRIFLYVSDSNQLQSFKWYKGDKVATLVTALIDWSNFSVCHFQNHRLEQNKAPRLVAELKMDTLGRMDINAGPMKDSMRVAELPWQSYDFDFAGLGFTWRALKNKQDRFWVHIADAGEKDGRAGFFNKGRAEVEYLGTETIGKKNCFKYKIDGAGLSHRGGHIWIDPETFMIQQYKIDLPDEPGFDNGMLELMSAQKMKPEEWAAFMKRCLGE